MSSIIRILLLVGLVFVVSSPGRTAAPPARQRARVDRHGDPLPAEALARLGTTRSRLAYANRSLALSPDGKTLAVVTQTNFGRGAIALLDPITGKERRRFDVNNAYGTLTFTADGKRVLVNSYGGLQVYDVKAGRQLHTVSVRDRSGSNNFAISADGNAVVGIPYAYNKKVALRVLSTATGKQLTSVEPEHTYGVRAALSGDGKLMASWGGAGYSAKTKPEDRARLMQTVQVWDVAKGKETRKLLSGGESVSFVAFSPDGKTMALATQGSSIQFWDTARWVRFRRVQARSGVGNQLTFSPDGKILVAATRYNTGGLQAWEVQTGRRLRTAPAPDCQLVSVAFPGKGKLLGCGTQGQAIVVWDALSGKVLTAQGGHHVPVSAMAFVGRRLLSIGTDGVLLTWDLSGKELRRRGPPNLTGGYRGYSGSSLYRFSPAGAYLASATQYSNGIRLLDASSLEEVFSASSNRYSNAGLVVAFSSDGVVASGSSSGNGRAAVSASVRRWKIESGEELSPIKLVGGSVAAVAFSPGGKHLAIATSLNNPRGFGARELEVRLWQAEGGKEVTSFKPVKLPGGWGTAHPLVFSPDGDLLVAADQSGDLHVLDARTGAQVRKMSTGAMVTTAPVFSPDGRSLAVATLDRTGRGSGGLALWELSTGSKRWDFPGVHSNATALAFSADGSVLASGHQDTTILLWDISGRRTLSRGSKRLAPKDLDRLWQEMGESNATGAFRAMRTLAGSPSQAVALLRTHVKPVAGKSLDAATIKKLVADLDDDDFDTRENAQLQLEKQGRAAEAALAKALKGKASAELRKRAGDLLAKIRKAGVPGEMVRPLRALEVLTWLDTAEARKLLQALGRGRADALITREAQATLARLKIRR